MIKDCARCGEEYETTGNQVYCTDLCRFLNRVDAFGDCWIWTGPLDRYGYGNFSVREKSAIAHRWLYSTLVGEVSPGLELDHLCYVRECVNPDHLQPVTRAVNSGRRRRYSPRAHPVAVSRGRTPRGTFLRLRHRVAL
jgi:hypothetical protein